MPGGGAGSDTTGIVSEPMPSISATIFSPGFRKRSAPRYAWPIPVPPDVPLFTTSPGNKVMMDDPYSISS